MSDLTYVRVGAGWNYVCLFIDLYNREIVGHAAGARKDARLVKSAFATLDFPLGDIEVFHTDRGSEFANNNLKRGLVHRESFPDTEHLRQRVNEWVWFYNDTRIHSTLGYMSPVEFREAGLSL